MKNITLTASHFAILKKDQIIQCNIATKVFNTKKRSEILVLRTHMNFGTLLKVGEAEKDEGR